MKICPCCAIEYTSVQWDALPFVGNQLDGDGMIELRNCSCGSTIAIEVNMGPGAWCQAASVYLVSARSDINDSAPQCALDSLKRAKERLEFAIAQLERCVRQSEAEILQAAE